MNDQNFDKDLVDPEFQNPRDTSPEGLRKHAGKLIRVSSMVIAFYSLLHKLFIPLFLKVTTVTQSPYKEIDPAWVVPVFFVSVMFSPSQMKRLLMPLSCGMAVGLGFFEIYRYFQGENVGWLVFSRLLSSGPMAFIGLIVFVRKVNLKTLFGFWTGVSMTLFGAFYIESSHSNQVLKWSNHNKRPQNLELIPLRDSTSCGQMAFAWDTRQTPSGEQVIHSRTCGFYPAVIAKDMSQQELVFSNELDQILNIHLWIYFERGQKRKSKNFVIPAKTSNRVLKWEGFKDAEFILVVSDNQKNLGLSLVVTQKISRALVFVQSDPPRLEIEKQSTGETQ
jgi:hypothetical protein